jgi:hypothetical protein
VSAPSSRSCRTTCARPRSAWARARRGWGGVVGHLPQILSATINQKEIFFAACAGVRGRDEGVGRRLLGRARVRGRGCGRTASCSGVVPCRPWASRPAPASASTATTWSCPCAAARGALVIVRRSFGARSPVWRDHAYRGGPDQIAPRDPSGLIAGHRPLRHRGRGRAETQRGRGATCIAA